MRLANLRNGDALVGAPDGARLRRSGVMSLEDAKIVMSVKNPESLVKGSTVRTGIPRRRRPARPMRSGRALRLLWLLSPRASAGPLRPPFLR